MEKYLAQYNQDHVPINSYCLFHDCEVITQLKGLMKYEDHLLVSGWWMYIAMLFIMFYICFAGYLCILNVKGLRCRFFKI